MENEGNWQTEKAVRNTTDPELFAFVQMIISKVIFNPVSVVVSGSGQCPEGGAIRFSGGSDFGSDEKHRSVWRLGAQSLHEGQCHAKDQMNMAHRVSERSRKDSDSWELLLDVSHSLGFFHAGTGDRRGDLNRDRLLQEQWRTSWDQEGLQRQWVTFQEPENTK